LTGCVPGYFCQMVLVIPFEEKYAGDFKQLNFEWLQQYFAIEAYDEYQLSHPLGEIVDKGDQLFLAMREGRKIGTVALMKETGHFF
jgi:hypothetical protein